MPVVNDANHLLGIISRVDVLSVFDRPDEEISSEVTHRVLPGIVLTTPWDYEVTVRDGIVTLSGQPDSEQIGRTLVDAVRHLQGVLAVRDRLSYPGDDSAPS